MARFVAPVANAGRQAFPVVAPTAVLTALGLAVAFWFESALGLATEYPLLTALYGFIASAMFIGGWYANRGNGHLSPPLFLAACTLWPLALVAVMVKVSTESD